MVITQTPFRMSFFGGGTDFPEFFNEYGGSVISSTFDKYCYVTVRRLPPFFDFASEIVYSKIERVTSLDSIIHPAVREAMKWFSLNGLRITYDADLPARTGLGTSSSFAVGLLEAFHVLKGDVVDKQELANEAIHLERNLCKESGGVQDQIAAAFGGLNRIYFSYDGFNVCPIRINKERKKELNRNCRFFLQSSKTIFALHPAGGIFPLIPAPPGGNKIKSVFGGALLRQNPYALSRALRGSRPTKAGQSPLR